MTCVYWEDKNTEEGQTMRWSIDGCWVSFSHENYTICSCSHLSTFALILQISEVNICASTFHIPSAKFWLGSGAGRYSEIGKITVRRRGTLKLSKYFSSFIRLEGTLRVMGLIQKQRDFLQHFYHKLH